MISVVQLLLLTISALSCIVSGSEVLKLKSGSQCALLVGKPILSPPELSPGYLYLNSNRGSVMANEFGTFRGQLLYKSETNLIPVVELSILGADFEPQFLKSKGVVIRNANKDDSDSEIEFDETEVVLVYCQKGKNKIWWPDYPKDSNQFELAKETLLAQLTYDRNTFRRQQEDIRFKRRREGFSSSATS